MIIKKRKKDSLQFFFSLFLFLEEIKIKRLVEKKNEHRIENSVEVEKVT